MTYVRTVNRTCPSCGVYKPTTGRPCSVSGLLHDDDETPREEGMSTPLFDFGLTPDPKNPSMGNFACGCHAEVSPFAGLVLGTVLLSGKCNCFDVYATYRTHANHKRKRKNCPLCLGVPVELKGATVA